jgi:hypothetical protein
MRHVHCMMVLAMLLVAACFDDAPGADADPPASADADDRADVRRMCEDLIEAQRAMLERCGLLTPLIHFADCTTVVSISDPASLYEKCIPALESMCIKGDTPIELGCNVLVF